MSESVTITLSRPLINIDQTLTSVTLREPTGKDMVATGYPIRFGADGSSEVDAKAMNSLIARIGNLSIRAMESMPAGDWQNCCLVTMSFFGTGGSPADSSADISNSPDGGAAAA